RFVRNSSGIRQDDRRQPAYAERVRARRGNHRYLAGANMHSKRASLMLLAMTAAPGVAPGVPPAGATITVNSTGDSATNDNTCTWGEGIVGATMTGASTDTSIGCVAGVASPAVDTIKFDIPITDPGCRGGPPKICTIALSSTLPDIGEPVL